MLSSPLPTEQPASPLTIDRPLTFTYAKKTKVRPCDGEDEDDDGNDQ